MISPEMSMWETLDRLTHAFEGTVDLVVFNTVSFYLEYEEFCFIPHPFQKGVVKKTFAFDKN